MTRPMTNANGVEEGPLPSTPAIDEDHLNYPRKAEPMTERVEEIREAIREAMRWSVVYVPPGEQGEAEGMAAAKRSLVAILVDPNDSDRVVITQGGEHVESCTRAEFRKVVA